jgi:hypothetical protein
LIRTFELDICCIWCHSARIRGPWWKRSRWNKNNMQSEMPIAPRLM